MTRTQPLPAIGKIVTFVAPNDNLQFTGRVVRSYGFAVAVVAISPNAALPMSVLEAGVRYTVVPSS
jgi:ribosomal protein L35AE/L33A